MAIITPVACETITLNTNSYSVNSRNIKLHHVISNYTL